MNSKRLRSERGGTPSFVKPFLHALTRMQERETLRPDQFIDRAVMLILDRFGSSKRETEAAFAHGLLGIQADHTNYFNGFALLMTLSRGMAVAVREASGNQSGVVIEGDAECYSFDLRKAPSEGELELIGLIRSVLKAVMPDAKPAWEIAIVGSVPAGLVPTFIASVTTALSRAIEAHQSLPVDSSKRVGLLCGAITDFLQQPFSPAYLLGSRVTSPDEFVVVDTETGEHLSLPVPEQERPGWVLIDTREETVQDNVGQRSEKAAEALERLRQRAFPELSSFRDLEHRDLEAAFDAVPKRLRPVLRYLVTENRRVQKLVAAIRRRDWQLFGALMFMSHSCRRSDWEVTTAMLDHVVAEAERFSIEGVYGATQTGEGTFVVALGQPFSLPAFLDHLRSTWPQNFSDGPDMYIL